MIEVLRAGPLTTVQDLGRPGWAHLGVPRSGALDEPALRRANRLVGNDESAAALETTLGGCAVLLRWPGLVAVTGAPAEVTVGGVRVPFDEPVRAPAGTSVVVGAARRGVRSYLAFAGGVAAERVLGSRATDTLSGLGPAPLRRGDRLPLGPVASGTAARRPADAEPPPRELVLAVHLGPRDDLFPIEAIECLLTQAYHVTPVSNRIGARLAGAALRRADAAELLPEGLVLGAIQVPPSGQPVVLLADHPTTGGYPVIAVVDDVTPLAQARPGTTVRFDGSQR